MKDSLYNDYLVWKKDPSYFFNTQNNNRLRCVVQEKHPWQNLINKKLYTLIKENPVVVDVNRKIVGVGYLGRVGNERGYVLFYSTDKVNEIEGIGLIKEGGIPHICCIDGPIVKSTLGIRNMYLLFDVLVGTEKLQEIELYLGYNRTVRTDFEPKTYGVYEGFRESIERLKVDIETLEIGNGNPYIVSSYGKREYR